MDHGLAAINKGVAFVGLYNEICSGLCGYCKFNEELEFRDVMEKHERKMDLFACSSVICLWVNRQC